MSADILSQNEIDALLSALSSGEMDADELKKEQQEKRLRYMILKEHYGFRRIKFEV